MPRSSRTRRKRRREARSPWRNLGIGILFLLGIALALRALWGIVPVILEYLRLLLGM